MRNKFQLFPEPWKPVCRSQTEVYVKWQQADQRECEEGCVTKDRNSKTDAFFCTLRCTIAHCCALVVHYCTPLCTMVHYCTLWYIYTIAKEEAPYDWCRQVYGMVVQWRVLLPVRCTEIETPEPRLCSHCSGCCLHWGQQRWA